MMKRVERIRLYPTPHQTVELAPMLILKSRAASSATPWLFSESELHRSSFAPEISVILMISSLEWRGSRHLALNLLRESEGGTCSILVCFLLFQPLALAL
jgi:hypothetical protein